MFQASDPISSVAISNYLDISEIHAPEKGEVRDFDFLKMTC